MNKILLVYTSFNTFVKADYNILSTAYEVEKYNFKATKKLHTLIAECLKQFFYLLINIWKFDSIYIWFGDYHSLLPVIFAKVFRKKSFIVIGGYDVTSLPEFKYGSLFKPVRRLCTYYSFKYATLCIPVVEKLEEKLAEFCPKAKSKTIHTGYRFGSLKIPDINKDRQKTILTVSVTPGSQRKFIKGLDRFQELALMLPDYTFTIIGVKETAIKYFEPIPPNLKLLPPLKQEELTQHYLSASFYAQFSRTEGLPNALCEAMLYGCVPLGLDIGGIGTAIENYGLILDHWNPNEIIEYIQKTSHTPNREEISRHIIERFDINYRIEKLLRTVSV